MWQRLNHPTRLILIVLPIYLLMGTMALLRSDIFLDNYFNYFAYNLLHGHLSLVTTPPRVDDLIFYQNKYYLFSPPSPVIFFLPLNLLNGIFLPNLLIVPFIASFNPLILYFILKIYSNINKIPVSTKDIFLICIFFAFGTTHFWQSIVGNVWNTGQLISQFFLLSSLLCYLLFLKNGNKKSLYIYCLMIILTSLGRNNIMLGFPFICLLGFFTKEKNKAKYLFFSTILSLVISVFLILTYNYIRFNNPFESGLQYHNADPIFATSIKENGLFSLKYIPQNLYYQWLNPLRLWKGWDDLFIFQFDPKGNSLFLTSPLFLYLFLYFYKPFRKYLDKKSIVLFITSLAIYLPIVTHFSSGWYQFGPRYLLDIIPFLLLLLLPIFPRVNIKITYILIFIAIFINMQPALGFA